MAGEFHPDAAGAAARSPGVFYEHIGGRAGARAAFGTGIPAFIGFAACRPTARADAAGYRVLHRWEQYDQVFQDLSGHGYLRHAVRGFFDNGGAQCVVVPASADPHDPAGMVAALTAPLKPGGMMEDLDQIDLICMPDLMMLAGDGATAAVYEAQDVALDHCRRMANRFAILDALPDEGSVGLAGGPGDALGIGPLLRHWESLAPDHGALYFPWVLVQRRRHEADRMDKAGMAPAVANEDTIRVPPCGHVAGVYARTDLRAGPHQAPANELVHEVVRLEQDLSDAQYAALNDKGVNCLRSVPGRGIRVWGARTLSGEPGWRYVNVRRLFLTLTRWVEHNSLDLVFETNNAQLWEKLAQRLRGYCRTLFDQGALAGRSPAEAFHVKCDAETNPRAGIDTGIVVAEVGLAPVVPAEFIVVRITQNAGGLSVGVPSGIE